MAEGPIARMGYWCFRHRWWVVAAWLVVVVAGALASGPVFKAMEGDDGPRSLESVQGYRMLDQGDTGSSMVAVLDRIDPHSPTVAGDVRAAASDVSGIPGVRQVLTPFDQGAPADQVAALTARDGGAVLVRVQLDEDVADSTVEAVSDRLRDLPGALAGDGVSGATVRVGGDPVINMEANDQASTDLSRAEELSLPITLVILVFVFGGLVAAFLPVLAAVTSVLSAMVSLFIFTKFTSIDTDAVTVVTLLGLGLSIDYGLLLVARFREELGAGFDRPTAITRAWATAGRTVCFSALTVAAALTGLLMFGVTGLSALGAAGVSISLVAMVAALTLTAAMLSLTGRRVRPSRRAAARRARFGDAAEVGFFASLARATQRRPVLTVIVTGLALLAAGIPLLTTTIHRADLDYLPRSLESVQVVDVLADRFGQAPAPAVTVVARTDPAALDTWAHRFADAPGVIGVHPAEPVTPGLSSVDIDVAGDPQGGRALALVDRVRADRPAGVQSWVTGDAAVLRDLTGLLASRLPWAVGLTVLAMFVLLFLMTGSVVVPLKALVMNVLSLGATFGVLNAVFEHGFLSGVLHTRTVVGLDPFVLTGVFAFAFGLSMDYEVFLLGRIKEYVDQGMPTDMAVRRGLQRSGRIITSAALLMVIVFSCFLVGRMGTVQQIGLGLAVAVAVDATIVRCVLVPATMTLLGRWNWWAPRPLARLHRRIGLGERVLPPAPVPPAAVPRPTPTAPSMVSSSAPR